MGGGNIGSYPHVPVGLITLIGRWQHFMKQNKSKFNHTIDIVIVAFECMLYNKHSDLSVVK
jgi:hypothetical protein